MRESGEDYIETIYLLLKKQKEVHAKDIADELSYSKPSITRAMNILKAKGLIVVDQLNHITLTKQGLAIAETVYEKHKSITEFLTILGVSLTNAEKDACRIEHVLSDESFNCIKSFISKK